MFRCDIIRDMEKIATDIYSFRELRENGFTCIDKTAILLPLCDLSIGKQSSSSLRARDALASRFSSRRFSAYLKDGANSSKDLRSNRNGTGRSRGRSSTLTWGIVRRRRWIASGKRFVNVSSWNPKDWTTTIRPTTPTACRRRTPRRRSRRSPRCRRSPI